MGCYICEMNFDPSDLITLYADKGVLCQECMEQWVGVFEVIYGGLANGFHTFVTVYAYHCHNCSNKLETLRVPCENPDQVNELTQELFRGVPVVVENKNGNH